MLDRSGAARDTVVVRTKTYRHVILLLSKKNWLVSRIEKPTLLLTTIHMGEVEPTASLFNFPTSPLYKGLVFVLQNFMPASR